MRAATTPGAVRPVFQEWVHGEHSNVWLHNGTTMIGPDSSYSPREIHLTLHHWSWDGNDKCCHHTYQCHRLCPITDLFTHAFIHQQRQIHTLWKWHRLSHRETNAIGFIESQVRCLAFVMMRALTLLSEKQMSTFASYAPSWKQSKWPTSRMYLLYA